MSSMAMMPKAPGLFSISTGWPRIGRMCSPTMRITMSVALPGPNGTTTLIGFEGYLSCACACTPPMAKTKADDKTIARRCMRSSHVNPSECALVGQLDFHLGEGLAPGGKLALEPQRRLVQDRARLNPAQLLS